MSFVTDWFRGGIDFNEGNTKKAGMSNDYYRGWDTEQESAAIKAEGREYASDQMKDHFTDDVQRRHHDELRRPKRGLYVNNR